MNPTPGVCCLCHEARDLLFDRWCDDCWRGHSMRFLWLAWHNHLLPHEDSHAVGGRVYKARRAALASAVRPDYTAHSE